MQGLKPKNFRYQAAGCDIARRVLAKIEWHTGELFYQPERNLQPQIPHPPMALQGQALAGRRFEFLDGFDIQI